ncbi:SRPBCC family protein [Streptomyces sp. NPDC014724]|uniref:SRPBCC family protein n=1 Tax=unclassified Streptomyces TaxID=2593676 RepID=UPI0036FDF232
MTDRAVTHATFTLERRYAASPATVFAAWADPEAKARWFAGPDADHELDFRVGGREINRGRSDGGVVLTFESWYRDIVPDERIVYTSTLSEGQDLATVSLTTVELHPEGEGTRLLLTEQGTFLDGREEPSWREQGTGTWLDALAAELLRSIEHQR